MSLRPAHRRARRGATAIEFALLLPIFVGLVAGLIDVSWMFWQKTAMQVAVADGCRVGAIRDPGQGNPYLTDLQEAARSAVQTRLEALGVACADCTVTVVVEDVLGVNSLECSMTRTSGALAGLLPHLPMYASALTQMEYQR